ncbi:MAG: hypothetical protein WBN34_08580 [Woeseia sp.]
MRDQDLMYWGMVVTMFLLIAALLTARELFERYLEERETTSSANAAPGTGNKDRQRTPPS